MLVVMRFKKRWLTFETGKVGDDNEPEIERPDEEKEEVAAVKVVGFSVENPYELARND